MEFGIKIATEAQRKTAFRRTGDFGLIILLGGTKLMTISPDMKAAWEQLTKIAMSGSAEAVLSQRCPACGSSLRIIFTPGKRTALGIRCLSCFAARQLDGDFAAPPWVESLGLSIATTI